MRILVAVLVLVLFTGFSLAGKSSEDDELRPLFVEGYPDQLSHDAGEEIAFHVSTSAPKFSIEVARVGAERKVVFAQEDIPGAEYPVPADASSRGCNWPESFRHRIPATWKSGYYSVKFRAQDGGGKFTHRGQRTVESEAFFVVRALNPGRRSPILIQLATNTYNAYNNWGGHSLYGFHSRNRLEGHRVSFNRPLRGFFGNWELPFVAWAERNGYELDYAINSDLERHPELLDHYRLVLSIGHDEYWSAKMRDQLEAYIEKGGNVAFLGGEAVCWQVRMEEEGRSMICWKESFNQDAAFRTEDFSRLTTLWSHYLVNRPENRLTGVGFLYGGRHKSFGQVMEGTGGYQVHRPRHWVFDKTGLKRGDRFGEKDSIVGPECSGCDMQFKDGVPVPTLSDGTPETFIILGTAPAQWHPRECEWYERWEKGRVGNSTMGVYTRGGTVFTAGTTDWSHGLRGGDATVERITRNVLDRLSKPTRDAK